MLPSNLIRKLVVPVTRMHVPFVSARIAHEVERHLSDRQVTCEVRGVRWQLDLNELIDHRIYYLGTHERFTTMRILEAVPRGGVFFDVGANFGYFTLLVAHQLRGTGKIYAFEPMGRAMEKMRRHIELNGFRNVVTEKVVLTDSARGPIEVAFQNSWRVYDNDEQGLSRETIPTTTLDDYVGQHGITRIDAMKVDVDGYEHKVFTGARKVLAELRPTLFIELGSYTLKRAGDSLDALVHLLSSSGYSFYSEMTMRPFKSPAEVIAAVPSNATINVVCRAK